MAERHGPGTGVMRAEDDEAWRTVALKSLAGADLTAKLTARSAEALDMSTLVTHAIAAEAGSRSGSGGAAPFTRGPQRRPDAPWVVAQRVEITDPGEANRQILDDLENGANGIVLVPGHNESDRGIALDTVDDVARLLDCVFLDLVSVSLDGGPSARRFTALISAYFDSGQYDPKRLTFFPAIDPIGGALRTGSVVDRPLLDRRYADTVHALAKRGFGGPLILLDGRPWSEAGAGEAQEIGYLLATAVEYLRWLEGGGIAPDAAWPRLAVKLAIDTDLFLSVAKIRATRLAFASLSEALRLGARPIEVRAESARRMLTRHDPHVNILRTTLAAFAAATAGADEIALHPFSELHGVPDAFARRLARNTQAILAEEAGLGRVADPAGGSGAVETLTLSLAERAWDVFTGVERAGGLFAALVAGGPQTAVAAVRAQRQKDVARRKTPLTGVSEFPLAHEPEIRAAAVSGSALTSLPPVQLWPEPGTGAWFDSMVAALRGGASVRALGAAGVASVRMTALPSIRLAEPFEALRDVSDAASSRPSVLLARLGTAADSATRATFARNLFEVAGFAVAGSEPGLSDDALMEAFTASGAHVVCLCSSDDVYAESAEAAARAMKSAGAQVIVLAGNPGARRAAYEAAGIEVFAHVGIDVVALLGDIQRRLGLDMALRRMSA